MAIGDDWTINTSTKKISHTSGSTVYTVNAMYSYLMDTFDELSYLTYDVPMSASTPTVYSMINSWTFDSDTDIQYLNGGSITDARGSGDLWSNIYTIGTLTGSPTLYVEQNGAVLTGYWSAGHIDIIVKVKSGSSLIDSGYLRVYARETGYTYSHYMGDFSAGGRNPVPLSTETDADNQTAGGTIATWSDVTVTFGSVSKDLNNGNGSKSYDVVIDCGGRTVAQVYERLKYITRRGETATLNSIQGQLYRLANGSYSEITKAPFGTFAGGKFFGARGIWIENMISTDVKNYQLIASDGTTQNPPNLVTVNVISVVSGDRIGVYKTSGGNILKSEYTLSSKTANTLVMSGAIAPDKPTSGYVRVIHSGVEYLFTYTGISSATFTGVSTDPTGTPVTNGDSAYVPYIDAQASSTSISNSLVYSTDIPVKIRVRKKGIIPFEIDGTVGSNGLSQSAIRTTDSIVT